MGMRKVEPKQAQVNLLLFEDRRAVQIPYADIDLRAAVKTLLATGRILNEYITPSSSCMNGYRKPYTR